MIHPAFTLEAYRELLTTVLETRTVITLSDWFDAPHAAWRRLILRHDVDFLPALTLPMARVEADLGIRSTWFVGIHLSYNAIHPPQAEVLKTLLTMDHEIGFHYDASVYDHLAPSDQRAHILSDIGLLERAIGQPIRSIAMHNPSSSESPDPFLQGLPLHNAYDSVLMRQASYASDSCRAWRPQGLACCLDPEIPLSYLLVHPELWTERPIPNWLDFLAHLQSLMADDSFSERATVESLWKNHPARDDHDARLLATPSHRD